MAATSATYDVIFLSIFLTVLSTIFQGCSGSSFAPNSVNTLQMRSFIESTCRSTTYPSNCVSTLAPYAGYLKSAKTSELAKVAVSVSLANCRNVTLWSRKLYSVRMSHIEKGALQDCVENFGNSVDQLKQSLAILKHLRADSFRLQMSDIQTYMSAALTNEDSCLDGFQTGSTKSQVRAMIQPKVKQLAVVTSNALALVNRCAASGGFELDL